MKEIRLGRALRSSIALAGLLCISFSAGAAEEAMALHCGRVIDMTSDRTGGPATIFVRDGRIERISKVESADAATGVDLRQFSCLPGLIDLHAHITIVQNMSRWDLDRTSARRALDGLYNAQKFLKAGFTTLRDPGAFDRYYPTVALRDAIAARRVIGPRLFVAPHALGPTGGHSDLNALAADLHIDIPSRTVDGVEGLRQAVRDEVKHGADWIKLMVTGGVMSSGDNPSQTAYTVEEIGAAVDETHRLGRRITVHAIGTEGIKASVRAGVDSVEHGILIDDETIALMKQRGTWLVPTLYVLNYVVDQGPKMGFNAQSIAKARALRDDRDRRIRRAFAAGVKIAFGSDSIFPPEQATQEFSELVRLGLTPMQALRAATVNAAQVLGQEEYFGSLAPGKYADIIAVEGSPVDDIRAIERVRFVMKDGRVINLEALSP